MMILLAGCASRPINEPITQVRPGSGYSLAAHVATRPARDPSTLLILAFSGGGMRAAALSYGVLEELRRTPIGADGHPRRLLDAVDIITGVSGGSFTALAYALYGERLFSEYETRFLKRNVQGELIARALNPLNWPKLASESYGRSELAAEYYDEILFEGATFGDLISKPTPVAMASSTDLVTGDRFPFMQENFNALCSDLSKVRLSRAAAASSAVPVALSPVTFNNYGGHCGYEFPAWVREAAATRSTDSDLGRSRRRYNELVELQNSEARPYLHLVDGGVSDNVAMRAIVELMQAIDPNQPLVEMVPVLRPVRRVAIIIVNAVSSPSVDWGKVESPPGAIHQLFQASSVPIDRYSYESVDLLNDIVTRLALERRLAIAEARLGGATEAQPVGRPPVELYVIKVSFNEIADAGERRYFQNLATSFVLPAEAVDRLREIAGRILRASPQYQRLLDALGGDPR